MATKKKELETMELTLEKDQLDEADKTKKKADEAFFAETKTSCKIKAQEWSERSRLRTEELHGIQMGIKLLNNKISSAIFSRATTTLLQLTPGKHGRSQAYKKIRDVSRSTHKMALAQLAIKVKTGGALDDVIKSIDSMITVLRKEGMEDIAHRDRCQNAEGKNKNDMEDAEHEIKKSEKAIARMEDQVKTVKSQIKELDGEIAATEQEMEKQLELRNKEVADFKQALKDDADAIQILSETLAALSKFYKRNKIPLNLRQTSAPERE